MLESSLTESQLKNLNKKLHSPEMSSLQQTQFVDQEPPRPSHAPEISKAVQAKAKTKPGKTMTKERMFEDDISYWGKDDINLEENSDTDHPTLSSGLTPRESRPRQQDWNEKQVYRAFLRGSLNYGNAYHQIRQGKAAFN